jgi:hypothetical protein
MADSWNPVIKQGETFTATITVEGVNLSGYVARSKGKTSHSATATVWSLSTQTSGLTITAGVDSVITMTLSATETAQLTAWTAGVYDIEYESPAGVVKRVVQGYYIVTAEAST